MRRKLLLALLVVLAACLLASGAVHAHDGDYDIKGYYNSNNRLMVPLRDVFSALGCRVSWNGEAVVLVGGGQRVEFAPRNHYYLVNGEARDFEVLPQLFNGRVMVDLSFVEDVSGLQAAKNVDGESAVIDFYSSTDRIYSFKLADANMNELYSYDVGQVKEVPILMYHQVEDISKYVNLGEYRKLFVDPGEFAGQLDWLKENNYSTITMEELFDHWFEGAPVRENPVVLTFDDGYRNMYAKVLPELVKRNMVATFFVCPGSFESERHLSPEMIVEMHEQGMEIGSHSISHRDLRDMSGAQLEEEVFGSKQALEKLTGSEVQFFAYPFGAYNHEVLRMIVQAGYRGAVTVAEGLAHINQGRLVLRRVMIEYDDCLEQFAGKITGAL